MKLLTTVCFEQYPADGGERELETFARAFQPIARLNEYPDLLAELANHGVEDFERARRIGRALSPEGDVTFDCPRDYLVKAQRVLGALRIALMRDRWLDYSPTPPEAVAVLLQERARQIDAIPPALALLDKALVAIDDAERRLVAP